MGNRQWTIGNKVGEVLKSILVPLSCWLLITAVSSADVGRWSSLGTMYGGVVQSMAFNGQYIYCGTYGDGIFRRKLDEPFWQRVGLRNFYINSLAIQPQNPSVILAGSRWEGLFISRNQGQTWNRIEELGKDNILDIQWHPKSPNLIAIVGYFNGIAISRDGGKTWKHLNRGLENSGTIRAVKFNSEAENVIFAATDGGGVFKSDNGGSFWESVNSGIPTNDVRALAYEPSANIWYAGTWKLGVYQSLDDGKTWQPINSGIPMEYPYSHIQVIEVDSQNPNFIYAGASEGLFISYNRGQTWELQAALLRYDIRSIKAISKTLLVGTWGGSVFRREDRSDPTSDWSFWNEGLTNINISSFLINPIDTRLMLAGTWSGGLYRSLDGGNSWQPSDTGITNKIILDLAIPAGNPNRIYASTDGHGIFLSEDRGQTWRPINNGLKAGIIVSLLIDPTNQKRIYAGTEYIGVFRSDDAGESWQPTGLDKYAIWEIALNPQNPDIIYVGTWGITAYADIGLGVLRSVDGGKSWQMVLDSGNAALALAIDPGQPEKIYVGTYGGGIFRSLDGGDHWQQINNGLDELKVWDIVIDPCCPDHLFAATEGGGVYYTENAGDFWTEFNEGLESLNFSAISFMPGHTNQLLIAGTSGIYSYTRFPLPIEIKGKQVTTLGAVKHNALFQNFPNPFNSETWIPFALAKAEHVTIKIYDFTGREIYKLDLGFKEAGIYAAKERAAFWNGRNKNGERISNGIYFYTMEASLYRSVTRKMAIQK